MTIPLITEDICLAVGNELSRKGIEHLVEGLEDIILKQPNLCAVINGLSTQTIDLYGILAGESMMRIFVLLYKIIETQFEVNELEEQGKL